MRLKKGGKDVGAIKTQSPQQRVLMVVVGRGARRGVRPSEAPPPAESLLVPEHLLILHPLYMCAFSLAISAAMLESKKKGVRLFARACLNVTRWGFVLIYACVCAFCKRKAPHRAVVYHCIPSQCTNAHKHRRCMQSVASKSSVWISAFFLCTVRGGVRTVHGWWCVGLFSAGK